MLNNIKISCIVCSRSNDITEVLKQNIESTIGCSYELIIIDNSYNKYSIFAAYKKGQQIARGEVLCFMHEDIIFHTYKWGEYVNDYFQKHTEAGLIGVAGSHFLTRIPSVWWDTEICSANLIQGSFVDKTYSTTLISNDHYKSNPTKVAVVDGLWMCMRKEMMNYVIWDDTLFNGFHGYDLDLSLQVWKSGYEVHVVWDILIEHKSMGKVSKDLYKTYDVLWNKWYTFLPLLKGVILSLKEQDLITRLILEKQNVRILCDRLERIQHSHAYKLGCILLRPIKKIVHFKCK